MERLRDRRRATAVRGPMAGTGFTDLRLGFYDEYHATPELLGWLLTDVRARAGDARLDDPYLLEHWRTTVRDTR
ncbi:hypothetical protein [Streptomyces sp. NPDC008125]|uniref:hypothetical protein n=1 Tax=Streptomyces sp. NPDC008125 TaxID=3364811 RepID=UPI0036E7B0C9